MVDFSIEVYNYIRVTDNVVFLITSTTIATWIIMGVLIAFGIVVRIQSRKWDPAKKPTRLQNIMEMCVETFEKFFRSSASEKLDYLAPWFFTLFAFLLFSNISGVFGIRNPTADWGVTFPLAVTSFILIQFVGFRYHPKSHLKGFIEPNFLFLPLNIMGELAKPISLSFRLFGNILGGFILMSLLYGLAPFVVRLIFPVALHLYFDIAAGALQAFIFTVLSLTFVGLAAGD